MGLPLYELAAEYRALLDELVDPETGEVAERPDALAKLDQLGDALAVKVDRVAMMVRTLDAEADSLHLEAGRLKLREQARRNAVERLKAYLLRCLDTAATTKLKTPLFSVGIQANPARLVITDEAALPREMTIVEVKPDTAAIKSALKAGKQVPGAELDESGRHIRIR